MKTTNQTIEQVATMIAKAKYSLPEQKLLLTLYNEEIINDEITKLMELGWESNRTIQNQPIEVTNYIDKFTYNNKQLN